VSHMGTRAQHQVALREYVAEVLKHAIYEKGEVLNVVVAEAPDLPGCFTQGSSFEEARENLIDAVEVWIMSALQCGEDLPVVNECRLAISEIPYRTRGVRLSKLSPLLRGIVTGRRTSG